MKFAIPEISWHNRDPVLSVDFQPKTEVNGPLRLASGGTDSHVLIWYITQTENGSVHLEIAADLTKHQKAINVVRWSPNGQLLASGDDESIIFVWKQKIEECPTLSEAEEQFKESWVVHKILRGHMEDILDICWNSTSTHLASGSVDNKLLVWDVNRSSRQTDIIDHKGFVQGVAWDPQGQLIVSASSDRVFRAIDVATKKVVSRSSKAILPFPKDHALYDTKVRLYHDDTLQTYYRRLQFSPDGVLIAVPAGRIEPEQGKLDSKPINAVYIYTRYSLKVPACVIPCAEPALAVRWAHRQYAPRPRPAPALRTAARQILAVATRRAVLLYDTQQRPPIALISDIHYTRLTDLTWSPDDRFLVASSTDGFCSVITFGEGELGTVLPEKCASEQAADNNATNNDILKPQVKNGHDDTKNSTSTTPKIDSFIKFKAPTDKSPKKTKIVEPKIKTPVKLDVLVETAMQSWSDNSSNDVVKPKEVEPMEVDEKPDVMIIEDSEDIKLVYEETEGGKSASPQVEKDQPSFDKEKAKTQKTSPKRKIVSPKQAETPTSQSNFLKQAKVTDIKEPVTVKAAPSPKAPRRVSFVTLSSPKNKKKC
ncbi:chromatin assembly factor 1 subunit B [Aricia agestis]|uniref:chromatin assembly factor 1 subunit B n=1 Tax=Aricia agestis TaxID=91739 RepID=UPI001C206014|nr:chromatin assembly factor 1 subunit B [Aricia agestis]